MALPARGTGNGPGGYEKFLFREQLSYVPPILESQRKEFSKDDPQQPNRKEGGNGFPGFYWRPTWKRLRHLHPEVGRIRAREPKTTSILGSSCILTVPQILHLSPFSPHDIPALC